MESVNRIIFFGIGLKINPIAFHIGNKPIYWYGIIIALGFCLGILYAFKEAKRTGFSADHITNAVIFGTPVAIICARLYYVIFNLEFYKKNPMDIFAIWNGGIAIYGGLIGAFLTAFIYCKIKKISFLEMTDVACGGFFIGQFIGRWGNFVNCEAYGRETSLPWKMGIYEWGRVQYVHPTFLYESLWNLAGFILLLSFRKNKKFKGELFFFYIIWYGIGRFFIEGLRTDSLYLGVFKVSQLVAVACVIVGTVCMITFTKKRDK